MGDRRGQLTDEREPCRVGEALRGFLGLFALGDVAAGRLVLDVAAVFVEESAIEPLLPTALAVRRQGLVFVGRGRVIGSDGRKKLARRLVGLRRYELPEGPSEQLRGRAGRSGNRRRSRT